MSLKNSLQSGLLAGLLGVFALLVSACAREPSLTSVEAWRVNSNSQSKLVAVCYSPEVSTRAQVAAVVVNQCPAETQSLTVLEDSALLNNCPISKRYRVTFECETP